MKTSRGTAAVLMTLGFGVTAVAVAAAAAAQGGGTRSTVQKAPTVLFMCPHGAAKSVLASAYFERAARERGLNVVVKSAGTEPDATVAPAVAAHLKKNGYAIPIDKPVRATAEDVAAADIVISIGCDLSGYPAPRGKTLNWSDVPSPSANFAQADAAIRQKVLALVEELVRQRDRSRHIARETLSAGGGHATASRTSR